MIRPLRRKPTNKRRSAAQFRGHVRKTRSLNITAPMRGGIRL